MLRLEATTPDDLKESVRYRGGRQRYGRVRFGSPNSIRVTVVLDEVGPNDVDLYADTGDYRMSVFVMMLADPDGGLPWNYVFSDGTYRQPKWHKVAKELTQTIDPIGKLELCTGRNDDAPPALAGEVLGVRPELYTGDGLLSTY